MFFLQATLKRTRYLKRILLSCPVPFLTILFTYHFAVAQINTAGTLDSTFGINGYNTYDYNADGDWAMDVASLPDTKIVIAGVTHFSSYDPLACRFRHDGTYDPTFNNSGCVSEELPLEVVGNSLFPLPDGRLLVSAVLNPDSQYVFCYLPDGTLDSSFANDGKLTIDSILSFNPARCFALQPDGKILYGGSNPNPNWQTFVLRFFGNGTWDTSFGSSGYGYVNSANSNYDFRGLTAEDNGKIFVFTQKVGSTTERVYRLNDDGTIDTSFQDNGHYKLNSEGLIPPKRLPGGNWIRAGNADPAGIYVTRMLPDFVTDSSFGINGFRIHDLPDKTEQMEDFTLQPDGSIIVAGTVEDASFLFNLMLLKLKPDGSPDTAFGINGYVITDFGFHSLVQRVVLDADEKIIVTGLGYDTALYFMFLARYNNSISIPTSSSTIEASAFTTQVFPNPFSDFCRFEIPPDADITGKQFVLRNQLGRIVKSFPCPSSSFALYRNNLPAGVYSYSINDEHDIIYSGMVLISP